MTNDQQLIAKYFNGLSFYCAGLHYTVVSGQVWLQQTQRLSSIDAILLAAAKHLTNIGATNANPASCEARASWDRVAINNISQLFGASRCRIINPHNHETLDEFYAANGVWGDVAEKLTINESLTALKTYIKSGMTILVQTQQLIIPEQTYNLQYYSGRSLKWENLLSNFPLNKVSDELVDRARRNPTTDYRIILGEVI